MLRAVIEGPESGPLLVLLHGFPQGWFLWRRQIKPLARAGFRVVVPDLRGYGGSSAPKAVSAYSVRKVAADVVDLASALGSPKFFLAAHDFGAIMAWNTALLYPQQVRAVFCLDVPFRNYATAKSEPKSRDAFWYLRNFQPVGQAEAEWEADLEASLFAMHVTNQAVCSCSTIVRAEDT